MESHQIRVRAPSSRLLAAERLGSPYSALICACDNRANCSVCARTARKKKRSKLQSSETSVSFPLELSVILVLALFIYLFCAGVSSRVNPCDIKVVFSSEISVLQTPNTDTITRGGGVGGAFNTQSRWKVLCFIVKEWCAVLFLQWQRFCGGTSGDGCWSIS